MISARLLNHVWPWIEQQFGFALRDVSADGPILAPIGESAKLPLFAVRVGELVAVAAREEWLDGLRPIVEDLHPDLLFSSHWHR